MTNKKSGAKKVTPRKRKVVDTKKSTKKVNKKATTRTKKPTRAVSKHPVKKSVKRKYR